MPTDAPTLTIPQLSNPFPAYLHPRAQEAGERAAEWWIRCGLGDTPAVSAEKERPGLLAAYMLPFGTSPERLMHAAHFGVWITTMDHLYVEGPARAGDPAMTYRRLALCQGIIDNPHEELAEPDPCLGALRDLWLRLLKTAAPQQIGRMAQGWSDYALGVACESHFLAAGRVVDPLMYRTIRVSGSAMRWAAAYIDYVGAYELSGATWNDPDIHRLMYLSALICGYWNDIKTLPSDANPALAGLAAVLAQHHGTSLQDGLYAAAKAYENTVAEFVRIHDRVRRTGTGEARTFAAAIEACTGGFLAWNAAAHRCTCDNRHHAPSPPRPSGNQ